MTKDHKAACVENFPSRIFYRTLFLGFSTLTIFLGAIRPADAERPTKTFPPVNESIADDLRYLASDDLAGRAVGTPEIDLAGKFIAERFERLGLRVDLFAGTPYQSLEVDTEYKVDASKPNYLRFRSSGKETAFEVSSQYTPLAIGSMGTVKAELAFVGYGISAADLSYDDYASLDVAGKVVIVLRKEPPVAPFGQKKPSPHAFFSTKSVAAAAQRAAAMIVVNDLGTLNANAGDDPLLQVQDAGKTPAAGLKIPIVFAKREAIDAVVKQALGEGLDELEKRIAATGRPVSCVIPGVETELATHLARTKVMAKNVLAELPGHGALANQTIILGAHYDHVGMGGVGSLAPGTIAVHNGADDNASGTAVLLHVAGHLAERAGAVGTNAVGAAPISDKDSAPISPRRRIAFIAFTGEESGLLGSQHYVRSPRWDLDQTAAMVNLDMVGRLVEDRLTVYGTGTGTLLADVVRRRVPQFGMRLDEEPSGYGPSDHQSFYEYRVPVLHFFTGLHNDYHRPSDDFEKINLSGLIRITDTVTEVVWDLATNPVRPVYQSTKRGVAMRQQPRAVLGVSLGDNQGGVGVEVSSVSPGSPAEKAGLLQGDRILQVNDKPVANPKELQEVIMGTGIGNTAHLLVVREGEEMKLKAELAASSETP